LDWASLRKPELHARKRAMREGFMLRLGSATDILVVLTAALPFAVLTVAGQRDPDDNTLHVVLPRDAIPAISNPEFEPASRADRGMADDELVIGVVGDREQRAYSTWQLDRHEIVNDTFEGRPIAVTW
jgi:hypothetical protein